jgi:hypothetical protein
MGDQDDGFALLFQPAQDAEQMVGLGRGQNAGGFVQNQDIGFAIQRLEDLDALLVADDRSSINASGSTFNSNSRARSFSKPRALASDGRNSPPFGPKDHVFQNRKILDQLEMLEHHADARADGGQAVGYLGRAAIDQNLSGIGAVEPVKDGHQRRFARAIFAHNPVDRAAPHADGDVLVGLHRAKCLAYARAIRLRGYR